MVNDVNIAQRDRKRKRYDLRTIPFSPYGNLSAGCRFDYCFAATAHGASRLGVLMLQLADID